MRRIFIFIIILILTFPILAQAGKKHCGPLWAVWTHSEDRRECMIKTTFWMLLIGGVICYTAKELKLQNALLIAPSAERRWEPIIWIGADSEEEYSAVGIKINW